MRSSTPVVSLEGITKKYGSVGVLHGIDLALEPGTITGLVGENGAGKSTLIKILAGAVAPTSGHVLLGGQALPSSTGAVIEAGLSVIYQELTDIPDMSLLDNVLLANLSSRAGFIDRRESRRRAVEGLELVGLGHLDPSTPLRNLTISQRQLAEIARCLVRDAKVLVLDEPTSSLPEHDVETLLQVVRDLARRGIAILYVTHHLHELFTIADRLVVLRNGALVGDAPTAEWTEQELVRAMLAKDLEQAYPWRPRELGEVALTATDIVAPGVKGMSVTAREREIVGLVGLAGAGRTEFLKAVSGVTPVGSGAVVVGGRRLRPGSIAAARQARVFYAPEDRKKEGLNLEGSLQANLDYGDYAPVSTWGFLRPREQMRRAISALTKYGVRFSSPHQAVGQLSGGNQQKVILARVAGLEPAVVGFDDPTRGVDVGAKSGIYEHILTLVDGGTAVLLTSSDTDEVLAVSDRVYVVRAGRIVGEFTRDQFDRERILHLASGGSDTQGIDS